MFAGALIDLLTQSRGSRSHILGAGGHCSQLILDSAQSLFTGHFFGPSSLDLEKDALLYGAKTGIKESSMTVVG